MRVIVVGAGQVGSSIAANLSEDHDVVVIDLDEQRVEELTYSEDVLAMEGDGTASSSLREAGIDEADMLIASTDDDETNLVTCGTADTLGEAFTIARVRSDHFLETWDNANRAFGVDFMVSTNLLAANDIVRVVGLPAAVDVDPFSGGIVQMAEFEIGDDSDLTGLTVAEADRFEGITFAGLVRNGEVQIPGGETRIKAGDRAIVIGRPASVKAFADTIVPTDGSSGPDDIVIVGGSDIGFHTAKQLEERGLKPRLIERDPDRARELAEALPGSVVMEHDATDIDFLLGEHVERADTIIATADSDEKNLLVSLLAKNIGVKRAVAIVEDGEYTDLFEAVGVDAAINPREATAEEIVRFTQEGRIENLSLIEGRQAEVIEIEVDEGSVLVGRPIRESAADLPAAAVIGAITRAHEFIAPRGDTVIEPGDHVVLFVATEALADVLAAV